MRALVFGQAPSRRSDPALPLSGRSGRLLAELAEFSGEDWYRRLAEHFELRNLLDVWPGPARHGKGDAAPAALLREAATPFSASFERGDRVVLLGRNVAAAFRIEPTIPYLTWSERMAGYFVVVFPHPSLVNRRWNEPEVRASASRLLRRLVLDVEKERGYVAF